MGKTKLISFMTVKWKLIPKWLLDCAVSVGDAVVYSWPVLPGKLTGTAGAKLSTGLAALTVLATLTTGL